MVVLGLDDVPTEPVTATLPITVGLLRRPPDQRMRLQLEAVTLTLTDQETTDPLVVPVTNVDDAVETLRDAVTRAPRAALACAQLLRQTERLDTSAGLAAEAAVYSMLLGGPEFARWLTKRGEPRPPVTPDHPLVLIERAGDRLSIVLNHPGRRNALSAALREELLDALLVADADPTIDEVRMTGVGPAFCSGGDLDEFGTATDLTAAYLVRLARAPWRIIDRIADRVTVCVHGACIGAGIEMAAFAGRVTAAPDAFFALPEVGMGLVPGAGGTVSVPRRIGRQRAAWLMLTGQRIDAPTALRWGLVDQL